MNEQPSRVENSSVRATTRTGQRPTPLQRRIGPFPTWILAAAAGLAVLVIAVAVMNTVSSPPAGRTAYDVGQPGVGEPPPDFGLPDANGATFRLSEQRGDDVLLYFHEGLMCAPCWQQIQDIERDIEQFTSAGVDQVVAISIDPLAAQARHAQQRNLTLPILADEDRSVSQAYDALSYGMMDGATPGHTFILVGPEGVIRWRADYGGPPEYTMYVPNVDILAEVGRILGTASR